MEFQENILLSKYTSIGLGGNASMFVNCTDLEMIKENLEFANRKKIKLIVLSGGSNIIFPDNGYNGLVLRLENKGIKTFEDENYCYAEVNAGENWDEFVLSVIEAGYSGIECLSGIPGSVGATPVQNVGAYGQEVKDSIVSVSVINRKTLEKIKYTNEECKFGYRTSRFKTFDKDMYIIYKVLFRFKKNILPEIKYKELYDILEKNGKYSLIKTIDEKLKCIRENVIALREKKSMVINPDDVNSRSCGSFFINPVLSKSEYGKFKIITKKHIDVPVFKIDNKYKVSAAWLVEKSGFKKGYRKDGVGISSNHSLALININGTTDKLLSLSKEIENTVLDEFGIQLTKEPVVIENL